MISVIFDIRYLCLCQFKILLLVMATKNGPVISLIVNGLHTSSIHTMDIHLIFAMALCQVCTMQQMRKKELIGDGNFYVCQNNFLCS